MTRPSVAGPSREERTLPVVARWAGVGVLAMAVMVLLGWLLDVDLLRRGFGPTGATTKVNAAIGLGLLAVFLVRPGSRAVPAAAGGAVLVGALTLVESTVAISLGIDELLVRDDVSGAAAPGRMAVATAASLVALGLAQLLLRLGRPGQAQWLLLLPGAASSLALLGWGFGVEELYGIGPYSTMAEQTAVVVGVLALGTAGLVPGGLLPWLLLDAGLGARLSRRMLPIVLVVIPVLGYVALEGEDRGAWGERFGHALMAAAIGGVFLLAILVASRQLDEVDAQRESVVWELATLNESLREGRDAEWRRAETLSRDLQQQQAQFQRAIGKVDDLVWTVEITPSGPAPVRLVFASPNATGVFGGEPSGALHGVQEMFDLVHPEDLAAGEAFLDSVVAGRHAEVELRVRGLDGVQRWLWVRGSPREEQGRLYVDGIATNITDRQELAHQRDEMLRLEQERVRALRELNRLREEFLATAGHELRSPLTSILGFAELLLETEDLTQRQRRYVQVITERTRQLSELVGDMFDLTRLESGMARLELHPTDLAEVVADAVTAHAPAATAAEVEITSSLDPVKVDLDPVRFRQVMDNLLSNAVRYARRPGSVTVSCGQRGHTALVTVADDGIGIPEGEHDRVFDRLYRGSNATSQGIRGTGLGLALTKAIVEAHHGAVTARPNVSRGTVFEVSLPLTAA